MYSKGIHRFTCLYKSYIFLPSVQYQTNNIRRNYTWERAMQIDFKHRGQPSQTSALKNASQRIHTLTLSCCKTLEHLKIS
ncbi:unnamed protein product [Rotaria magnacalcarata]